MDTGAFLCHRGTCGAKGGIYDLAEHLHVQPPETMRRAQSLQSFLSGKSLARTARNNYARETTVDGKTIPCPNYWHM